jgi:hypothetical protein
MTTATTTALTVQDGDVRELLPRDLRNLYDLKRAVVRAVDDARPRARVATMKSEADRHLAILGADWKTIERWYYKWINARRDDRVLIDFRKLSKRERKTPLLHCYKWYCERNQRASLPAWRAMIRDLMDGKVLTHYGGDWTKAFREEHGDEAPLPRHCPYDMLNPPKGWKYSTLQKLAGLTDYERKASRVGATAAADCVLPVLTTRVGLHAGEAIEIDDKYHDANTNFAGQTGSVRVLEFKAIDGLSGKRLAYGLRPRTVDEETGKRDNLKEKELRFMLAHLFCNVGFYREGCWIASEHGTAAVRGRLKERLSRLSNGRIKVVYSSILGAQVHEGLWPGRGKGNFKLKAMCESLHGFDHNELASLPGQVGKDRDHCPEQFHGLDAYNTELLKAMCTLTEAQRQLLRSEILPFHTYCRLVAEVYDRMDDRKDHRLEGWEACGFEKGEIFNAALGRWFDASALDQMTPDERTATAAVLRMHPEWTRVRRLSPREVWHEQRENLDRLSRWALTDIMEREDGFSLSVQKDGTLRFRDRYLGPDVHVYHANVTTPAGFRQDLVPLREYWCYITPYEPENLYVCNASDDSILGIAPRYDRAPKYDFDAVHALQGAQNHRRALLNAPIKARHQDEAADRIALIKHNDAVIAPGHPIPDAPPPAPERQDDINVVQEIVSGLRKEDRE